MPASANTAIFLSSASQDTEAARRIADSLRASGIEVWFGQKELTGGDAWDRKIREQIATCALFLPLISANTQARKEGYFRLEWKLAAQRTHMMSERTAFLLPVVIDAIAGLAIVAVLALWQPWKKSPAPTNLAPVSSPPPAAQPPPDLASAKSVAVLAFANMSADKDTEYFSDGVSEELVNVLAKLPGLKVSARTSAFFYKGKQVPLKQVAQELGVAYIVEGSVRKSGDRVRTTAQLIKADDSFHVWSDTFDRELKDIFAVQDEIAGLIAKSLSLKLGLAPAASSGAAAPTKNLAAYDLYLRGRAAQTSGTGIASNLEAVRLYEEALRLDPGYALASARLAQVFHASRVSGSDRSGQSAARARDAALTAVRLDPHLPEAHLGLARVRQSIDYDLGAAQRELDEAERLRPNDRRSERSGNAQRSTFNA